MAIQQLTQPILNPIVAFDATQQHIISFIVIGGTQVVANRLTVQDNQTGNVIYSQIQSSLKLEHILPANTLQNGGYYNAVIETIDNANNISSPSTPVPFYCYSSPTLTITNIPATETIGNGTYKFEGNYSQTEGELLNSYQFTLYNSNKEVLTQTPLIYYSVDNSLSYTFVGMNNDTSYYIELSGQTVNNTKITTGLLYFTVRYIQPASFAICDLVNNCDDGYIQVSSNIVAIDGHSNPDPPIYIDDKEVDLTDPDAWVNWNSGFRIQDDFTMGAWGRDFNDYQNIITLTNDINTEKTPNRIELKWMIGDVLKEQLYYENINGKFINIENSKVGDIKNLEIYGNSTQFTTSAEYNTASGNPVQFEDGKEGTSLRIQELDGKSTQATRSGKNLYSSVLNSSSNVTINNLDLIFDFSKNIDSYARLTFKKEVGKTYTFVFDGSGMADGESVTFYLEQSTQTFNFKNGKNVWTQSAINENSYFTLDDKDRSNISSSITLSNIMILEGEYTEETIPEYEPYGASPSPEFPSEIKSIGDDVNLAPKINNTNYVGVYPNSTIYADNEVSFDLSAGSGAGISSIPINVKDLKTISLSACLKSTDSNTKIALRIYKQDGTTALTYGFQDIITTDYKRYIINNINVSNEEAVIIKLLRMTTTGIVSMKNVKLQKGTVATPYSEYGKSTVTIEQRGKNLINPDKPSPIQTDGGITITNNGDGSYTAKGTSTKALSIQLTSPNIIKLKANTYYTNSIEVLKGTMTGSITVTVKKSDNTISYNYINVNNSNKTNTQISVEDLTIYSYSFYCASGREVDFTFRLQLEEGTEATDYEPYFSKDYVLPLSEPLRSLPNGVKDTLEADGIHRKVGRVVLDGSNDEVWGKIGDNRYVIAFPLKRSLTSNVPCFLMSNYFKSTQNAGDVVPEGYMTEGYYSTGNQNVFFNYNGSNNNLAEWRTWLSNHPTEVIYELKTKTIEPYTDEQKKILNSMVTEKGTNIINSQTYMILNYNYISANIPSPNNKLPIFSVGDIKNLINISNLNISYNQKYYLDVNTQFLLKPNYTYTLSFDFNINEASTDLYYSLGYGTDIYAKDITKTTIYSTQTKGRNEITFTVPADIPDNSYLWVRFARTIILADINVDISNIQLEKGKSATSYQSPNEYNIYPIITENNFYDYNNPLYVKGQNVIYTEIDNGYNIKPKIVNTDTYLAIGIKNILTNGNLYGISYSILGELDNVRLYRTNKNSQNIIDEIKIDKGIFIAPNSSYDLQLVFNINSSSLLNYVQIWNIQLEANDVISSYQLYNKNYSQIILEEPLRGIEKYQDWIGITSPNLLNPETGSAKVEEETDYFYNKLVTYTTNVTVQYKNISGNIISSEILAQDSLISTPKNCVEIHIEGLDKETIKSNHLQIRKGTSNEPYLPYITEPSLIKVIGKIVLDGSEDWQLRNTNSTTGVSTYSLTGILSYYKYSLNVKALSNYFNYLGTVAAAADMYKKEVGVALYYNTTVAMSRIIYINSNISNLNEFKTWLSTHNTEVIYVLEEPEITPLSSLNSEALKALETYEPISNIFTNNDVLATLSLDYANSMILQDTQNAYVLLKCWNGNKMPYVIHSNYIDIPETTDNVFIWMRRKKNIFDLKIENLTKGS